VRNAAALWKLIKQEKMANTTVVVSGAIPGAAGPAAVARSAPLPPGPNEPRYGAPPSRSEPRYDYDRPLLFPFFSFER